MDAGHIMQVRMWNPSGLVPHADLTTDTACAGVTRWMTEGGERGCEL